MHLLTLWCQRLEGSGLTITGPWKFYYVTCLGLWIITSDNFIAEEQQLLEGQDYEEPKNKMWGFKECGEGFCGDSLP